MYTKEKVDNYKHQETWKSDEDQFLRSIVPKQGKIDWTLIERTFNSEFAQRLKTAKQLRERYTNHSRFDEGARNQAEWAQPENRALFDLYLAHGAKWTELSASFQGRSENSLKNKFYGTIRKLLRRINALSKKLLPSYTKPLKYEAFVRVLEVQDSKILIPKQMMGQAESLRAQIIKYCLDGLSQDNPQQFITFIRSLHQFNLKTRCYRLKKSSKKKNSSSDRNSFEKEEKNITNNESFDSEDYKSGTVYASPQVCPCLEKNSTAISPLQKKGEQSDDELRFILQDQDFPIQVRQEQKLDYQACQILGITYNPKNQFLGQLF